MPQYEYRRSTSARPQRWTEIDLLNDAGADGWRVVHITTTGIAYLERVIPDPPKAEATEGRGHREPGRRCPSS